MISVASQRRVRIEIQSRGFGSGEQLADRRDTVEGQPQVVVDRLDFVEREEDVRETFESRW